MATTNKKEEIDLTKPYCYWVDPMNYVEGKGFIPSIVIAGESGHRSLTGNGEGAVPWYWGNTLDEAERICEKRNREIGVSKRLAMAIVNSSMSPNENTINRVHAILRDKQRV